MQDLEQSISANPDVVVAAYDDVSDGRGTPAAHYERVLLQIIGDNDQVGIVDEEEEFPR